MSETVFIILSIAISLVAIAVSIWSMRTSYKSVQSMKESRKKIEAIRLTNEQRRQAAQQLSDSLPEGIDIVSKEQPSSCGRCIGGCSH